MVYYNIIFLIYLKIIYEIKKALNKAWNILIYIMT